MTTGHVESLLSPPQKIQELGSKIKISFQSIELFFSKRVVGVEIENLDTFDRVITLVFARSETEAFIQFQLFCSEKFLYKKNHQMNMNENPAPLYI